MPILNVAISGSVEDALASRIASELTELTRQHLKKDPTLTAVTVSGINAKHWFAGGRSLADQQARSFWLDIKVVDGTNTKQEMQSYLEAVHAVMGMIIEPLHGESYVLVHEVPAHAYGFGGRTQEYRFISKQAEAHAKLTAH